MHWFLMWTQVSVVKGVPSASGHGLTRAKKRSICNRSVLVY